MPPFFQFRKTSNEVTGASRASVAADLDRYHDEIDPRSTPNGLNLVPTKIVDGNAVRNATAGEIAGFQALTDADDKDSTRTDLKSRVTRSTSIDAMLETIATSSGQTIATVRTTYNNAVDTN